MQLDLLGRADIARAETYAPPQKVYAYYGDVVRVTERDFAQLQKEYRFIEDLMAQLAVMDAYYACNSETAYSWMGLKTWLLKENNLAKKRAAIANYGNDWD